MDFAKENNLKFEALFDDPASYGISNPIYYDLFL
jgi:hypothetical protein